MSKPNRNDEEILRKLRSLPLERLSEVEDFVDFLCQRDEDAKLATAASKLSEDAFPKCLGQLRKNADYDRL